MSDDERALMMLEKSIYEAQEILEKEQTFRPFALLLDENGEIERVQNALENVQESYMALYEEIKLCVEERPMDIIVLLADTTLPDNLRQGDRISAIRVHLEERSQQYKKIAGRYIYIPYQLQRLAGTEEIKAKLFTPKSVSFPLEFLK